MTALAAPAPTLGDMLALARARSAEFARWLEAGDPATHARLVAHVAAGGSLLADVRAAIAAFAADAGEEDWASLLSAARAADDPGRAVIGLMLRWWMREGGAP